MPYSRVRARWGGHVAPLREEHARLEHCEDLPDATCPFTKYGEHITPVAIAALLLHGRASWGADWYETTCYLLFSDLPPDAADSPSRVDRSSNP